MKNKDMDVADCNNHVKSALEFFGSGCAVNSLSDKYNPLGDNSDRLCDICGSDLPGVRCTSADPYAGYEGAIGCLLDRGEIAFVTQTTPKEYFAALNAYRPLPLDPNDPNRYSSTELPFFAGNRPQQASPFDNRDQGGNSSIFPFRGFITDDRTGLGDTPFTATASSYKKKVRNYAEFKQYFDLLCLDGSRRDIEDWKSCNWDRVPSHSLVTSSVKSPKLRLRYQRFIQGIVRQFGEAGSGQQTFNTNFKVTESAPRYGNRSNLLVLV